MKEAQSISKAPDEQVQQVIAKKKILQSKVVPGDGHRCFEFNIFTNEMREIEVNKDALFTGGQKQAVNMKDGFIYITALNAKNASKKLGKIGVQKVIHVLE